MRLQIAARLALVFALFMLVGTPAFAQLQSGRIVGTVFDTQKAGIPGATITVTNLATNLARSAVTDSEGNYVVTPLDPGTYNVSCRDARLPDNQAGRTGADSRTGGSSRADAQSRHAVDRSAGHRRNSSAQYRIGDVERGHHERADRRSSAQRPWLPRAGAADVGRGAAAADRQHAARPPRGRQRQRHRRRRRIADPIPSRWRGHHRRASGRHLDSDFSGRASGVQRSAERVLGRIPRRRRHVQRDDQVGRQRVSRQPVRVHAQRQVRFEELLRREQREARAQSVRWHARRPVHDSGHV